MNILGEIRKSIEYGWLIDRGYPARDLDKFVEVCERRIQRGETPADIESDLMESGMPWSSAYDFRCIAEEVERRMGR